MLSLVVGLGIVAFLFLYFAFNLDNDHFLLKLLLIFFFAFTILLIPHATIQDDCEMKMVNETVSGNLTTYDYARTCDTTDSTSKTRFLWIVMSFVMLFVLYFSIYLVYHYFMTSREWLKNL